MKYYITVITVMTTSKVYLMALCDQTCFFLATLGVQQAGDRSLPRILQIDLFYPFSLADHEIEYKQELSCTFLGNVPTSTVNPNVTCMYA